MSVYGACDCGGEDRFQFTVRGPAAASTSNALIPKAVCACTKCLLVAEAYRAEVLLFETEFLSLTGGVMLEHGDKLVSDNVNNISANASGDDVSVFDLDSVIICNVCKLCVGFQFPQIGYTAVSRRVVNPSTVEPSIPPSTLSKYCTQYFSGLSLERLQLLTSSPSSDESVHYAHHDHLESDCAGSRPSIHPYQPDSPWEEGFPPSSDPGIADHDIASMDCVVRSLNAAASQHRARLLNRVIAGDAKPLLDKEHKPPARHSDVCHEEQLRELHADCHAMHAKMRGRMATMSAALHHLHLNN